MTLLERIRRRRRFVAGAVLPLLAVAWLDGAALACIGMARDGAAAAEHSRAAVGGHVGDHHGAPRTASSASHDEQAATHTQHEHHAGGDAVADALPPDPTATHDHGDCPHCPVTPQGSHGPAAAHVACDVADGTGDQTRSGTAAAWDAKHSLPLPTRLPPMPAAPATDPLRAVAQAPPAWPGFSLNVRYCVFVI